MKNTTFIIKEISALYCCRHSQVRPRVTNHVVEGYLAILQGTRFIYVTQGCVTEWWLLSLYANSQKSI